MYFTVLVTSMESYNRRISARLGQNAMVSVSVKLIFFIRIVDFCYSNEIILINFRGLMLYGLKEDPNNPETEDLLASDPDICLIPNIVQKVILPKLTGILLFY